MEVRDNSLPSGNSTWRPELLTFAPIYFFLSLINLRLKIQATPGWFDGELAQNHALLLARDYTNNEQSRLFQFLIPELLVRVLGVSVEHAYLLQRWIFVWLGFVLFHFYLRRWFGRGLALGGVCLLAAVLPLTHYTDLQESAPFLMVSFLAGLWSIRDGPGWLVALVLMLGTLNNETTLVLPAVYFFFHLRDRQLRSLWDAGWRTLAVAALAYSVTALIRYVNRDRPHLGGAWHLPDNLGGLFSEIQYSPFDYYRADYLCVVFLFGVLWCYAYLGFARKPPFIRATLLMLPFFLLGHLVTGIIFEVRQMIPMAYVIIPAAFCWLFPDDIRFQSDTSSP